MNKRLRQTTTTTLVMDHLRRVDDFVTARQLQAATGRNCNQVSAALHQLHVHRAVDCVASDRQLWWFATPDSDTRIRTVDEKAVEDKPRRPRKARKAVQ